MNIKHPEGFGAKQRREAIREIIQDQKVTTQQKLVEELVRRGFDATQSTVSRDLRELELVKTDSGKGRHYAAGRFSNLPPRHPLRVMITEVVRNIEQGQNLLVIHTKAGQARRLAEQLDRWEWKNKLGTVAGEDTVLLVAANEAGASEILEVLRGL